MDDGIRIGQAWLALCGALAVHVFDEAVSGFLEVYNPAVLAIRARVPWLPLPVFRFDVWLTGLTLAIVLLFALSVFVFRGARWTRWVACWFAILMTANAVGHTVGTILGPNRPMPGFFSSPLLLAASILLLVRLRSTTWSTAPHPR